MYSVSSNMRKTNREVRELYLALKSRPCADCGRSFDPVCMDFDHRPGTTKVAVVSRLLNDEQKLLAEIEKCDLICACCHRLRTKSRGKDGTGNKLAYKRNPQLRITAREAARRGMSEYWKQYKLEKMDDPIEKEKRRQRALKAWETKRAKGGTSLAPCPAPQSPSHDE